MKEIRLTQGKAAIVDDADFPWLNQWKWHSAKIGNTYYAKRCEGPAGAQIGIYMHRLILGVTDREMLVDHQDGDGLNNQRVNIRPSTPQQNQQNRRARRGGTSKFKGVSVRMQRGYGPYITAGIRIPGKSVSLGAFSSEEDAARAYDAAAKIYHGEFANLNFPEQSQPA